MGVSGGNPFKICAIAVLLIALTSHMPVVGGLAFLEKDPNELECLRADGGWAACSKDEVCSAGDGGTILGYRAVVEDPEYLNNWVIKFDMLCEPFYRKSMLASAYYTGSFLTIIALPMLADNYGRKHIFDSTMVLSAIIQLALIFANDLDLALWEMMFLGMTFGGKSIVGLNYLLEFISSEEQPRVVLIYMFLESSLLIYITLHYKYLDRNWLSL